MRRMPNRRFAVSVAAALALASGAGCCCCRASAPRVDEPAGPPAPVDPTIGLCRTGDPSACDDIAAGYATLAAGRDADGTLAEICDENVPAACVSLGLRAVAKIPRRGSHPPLLVAA